MEIFENGRDAPVGWMRTKWIWRGGGKAEARIRSIWYRRTRGERAKGVLRWAGGREREGASVDMCSLAGTPLELV
jgi:hypothetical protein